MPRDGLVLGEGVADEPPGADPQEVLHRVRGVPGLLQLLLQGREGVGPEALVDAPVLLQTLVPDGLHVGLLIGEVLHGVALEKLDALLTGPLAVLLLLLEGEEAVDDLKEPLVLLVDGIDPNVE